MVVKPHEGLSMTTVTQPSRVQQSQTLPYLKLHVLKLKLRVSFVSATLLNRLTQLDFSCRNVKDKVHDNYSQFLHGTLQRQNSITGYSISPPPLSNHRLHTHTRTSRHIPTPTPPTRNTNIRAQSIYMIITHLLIFSTL